MKTSRVGLAEIADWHNLATAFYQAAKGARHSSEVARFRHQLEHELATMKAGLLRGDLTLGRMRRFRIYDPKPREIHAPCFRERVIHHAVMAHVGPVLDRALIDDTFACRPGKGTLAAVKRCQHHLRRFPWFIQIDIRGYFASIDHLVLLNLLKRKFRDPDLLSLLQRILDTYSAAPGKGLPIGALTSQHFANYYLAGADRLILEDRRTRGIVRYMDDIVWFCDDRERIKATLSRLEHYIQETLKLTIKQPVTVGPSRHGLVFCGHRILPGAIRLTRRRKKRYAQRRRAYEQSYLRGEISAIALQAAYASVLATTIHANAVTWRREQLRRVPLEGALNEL
jgi:retron-type reverse transcriptase